MACCSPAITDGFHNDTVRAPGPAGQRRPRRVAPGRRAGRPRCAAAGPPVSRSRGVPAGMVNRNSAPPPGAWCTAIVPPCASTRPFTMNRPRPAPPRRLTRQNCRNTRGASSGAMPCPWSRTETATPGAFPVRAGSTMMVTVPAPCRTAFSMRLARIWKILSASSQVSGRPSPTSSRNLSSGSPAATRPSMTFLACSGMSTSSRCTSIRPDSIRDTSSSSVISLVTRSASELTVSSMTSFWSSVNRGHLASSVAVKPLTLVSGERSSWATVETRSARPRSARARCCAPRSVIVSRRTAPGCLTPSAVRRPSPARSPC